MAITHSVRQGFGLNGAKLLVVEDDFLLLMDLKAVLSEAGAERVEGCQTLDEALAHADADDVGAAILDVRIGSQSVEPVARRLTERGTPFVFYTGQVGNDRIVEKWPDRRIVSKPAQPHVIVAAVADMLRH